MTWIPSDHQFAGRELARLTACSLAFLAVAATIQGFRSKAQSFGRFDLIGFAAVFCSTENVDKPCAECSRQDRAGCTYPRPVDAQRWDPGAPWGRDGASWLDTDGVFLAGSELTARTGENWRRT
ncbi:hypothetical protein GQ55_9G548000 [Panicum hallii var. hallii]|uniref:Uncharacterized protein n=1 Tax=Panicum hallii var. hallii TaxID=1504633 RepID=A0A2T7CF66_9POAL|nr:hypothetical protein GQ55_9G548000 [Panicum hallii var. hallii]